VVRPRPPLPPPFPCSFKDEVKSSSHGF
jgi:hypothetical protein